MKIHEIVNLMESSDSSIDALFDVNGDIVQEYLKNFDLFRGAMTREFLQKIILNILKTVWEDNLYEIIEENIIADDGYSIRVEPALTKQHHEDLDCYATLETTPNHLYKIIIWFKLDTDVQGNSFAQQIADSVKKLHSDLFSFKLYDYSYNNIPNWDAKELNVYTKTVWNNDITYTFWGWVLLDQVLKAFSPEIQIVNYPTKMLSKFAVNINKVNNLPVKDMKLFFARYNFNMTLTKGQDYDRLSFKLR